ncbi:MAG TPA: M48 family metallopeptidase [Bacteroidales bacterium]|nr:M48 family metallopeptidase [Bacteroidales bacterium]
MENKKPDSINYSLIKSSRKSIGIIVNSDGSVVVRAPQRATKKEIDDVINKRIDWILKHQKKFEQLGPAYSKWEFVDGEKHLLLGNEYVLRVNTGAFNTVRLNGKFIDVVCNNESMVKPLMVKWYTLKANEMMPDIIMPVVNQFKSKYHRSPAKISLKNMKSRWGSCSSKANISMNIKLIKSTRSCIEYVMAHELCHLIQMNHSKNYYTLLTEFMPDWRERKKELDHFMR